MPALVIWIQQIHHKRHLEYLDNRPFMPFVVSFSKVSFRLLAFAAKSVRLTRNALKKFKIIPRMSTFVPPYLVTRPEDYREGTPWPRTVSVAESRTTEYPVGTLRNSLAKS